jgi:hypothetical protein
MPDQGGQAQIGAPEMGEYLRPQYANTVASNFTPWDFRIIFSLLAIPPQVPGSGKNVEVHPQAVADIVLPAAVMHSLIALLQRQFDQYLDQYGAPGLNPEGPKFGDEGLGDE